MPVLPSVTVSVAANLRGRVGMACTARTHAFVANHAAPTVRTEPRTKSRRLISGLPVSALDAERVASFALKTEEPIVALLGFGGLRSSKELWSESTRLRDKQFNFNQLRG